LLCFALAVLACGEIPTAMRTTAPTRATTGITGSMRSLTIGGTQRSYLVVAPADQHTALPLLMVLHGRAVTVQQEEIRTDFLPLARQGKAVLVYPAGYGQSWNAGGGCCGAASAAGTDDSAFLAAVVGEVRSYFAIDDSRVYLVGYSNGARMAFTEICTHPTLFTAFATYGGVPPENCGDTSIAVSAWISAGTADPELSTTDPIQTSTQVIESVAASWRARDGCAPTPTRTTRTPAQLTEWARCRNGSAVESVLYHDLNHYWPRATQVDSLSTTAVGTPAAAATLIWAFLSSLAGGNEGISGRTWW
jgi:polyhydroxybutyrate depolymerase